MNTLTIYKNDVIRHLTPTALALLSVELERQDRNSREDAFLDQVNNALVGSVGEDEAQQLRFSIRQLWSENNI